MQVVVLEAPQAVARRLLWRLSSNVKPRRNGEMRYDPVLRRAKYESLMNALIQDGFSVSVATEANRVDGMGVECPHSDDFHLFVCCRLRGWYLHIPRGENRLSAIYQIPQQVSISSLLN